MAGLNNADGNSKGVSESDIQDMLLTEQKEITKAIELFVESVSIMGEAEGGNSKKK